MPAPFIETGPRTTKPHVMIELDDYVEMRRRFGYLTGIIQGGRWDVPDGPQRERYDALIEEIEDWPKLPVKHVSNATET